MPKKRKRKIRTFTIPDDIYERFRKKCRDQDKYMSREIEKMMKGLLKNDG